jgi:putative sporulation protein YyaC
MNQTVLNEPKAEQKIYYYNPKEKCSIYDFCKTLANLIRKKKKNKQELVLLCIGSDRATGDCLGPIIGYKLSKLNNPFLTIYGTLEQPVHAKNLTDTIQKIKHIHKDSLIIAIDASLGTTNHLGYITLGEGSLNPGIGVDKELPSVGDIFITGIVNISGMLNHMLLQTTRLDVVMKLADFICMGIRYSMYIKED